MGGAGGCGVVVPCGALGEGVGSAIAIGCGGGGNVGFIAFVSGCLMGFGGSGGGATLGIGGSINWLRISAGTTISMARRTKPLCKAHMAATWNKTTLLTITKLRFMPEETVCEGIGKVLG